MKTWLYFKKRLVLPIMIVTSMTLQGCSAMVYNSDRIICSEAVPFIDTGGVFLYETMYETDEGRKYGIGSYDPISGETIEVLKGDKLENIGIADIASTEHHIIYVAYKEANKSGNGQVLYVIDFDGGRRRMLGETAYKYTLYTADNAVIINDKDTSEFFVFEGDTHKITRIDIEFGEERKKSVESNGYSFSFFKESNGDISVSTIRDAEMRPVLHESLDGGQIPFGGEIVTVGRDPASGLFFYQMGDENRVEMTELNKKRDGALRFSEMDFCVEGNRVIGRVIELKEGAFADGNWSNTPLAQKWIRKEYFIQLPIEDGEDLVLYETKDNNERIVGYYDNKLYFYIKGRVEVLDLDERVRITKIDGLDETHDLFFLWRNGFLIVFDEDAREVIGRCK